MESRPIIASPPSQSHTPEIDGSGGLPLPLGAKGRTLKNRLIPYISLALVFLGLLALAAACDGDDGDGGRMSEGNLFPNPGFEEGRDPACGPDQFQCWFSLKPPDFILSEDVAHSGSASAYLRMRDNKESPATKVYYLVQEITAEEFPEVISGYYRVDDWVKGTEKQYLQFVVIAFGSQNLVPVCPEGGICPNYQIRYILAGIDEEPFPIVNAKFVFLSREEPKQGQWISFERNLGDDFRELWGDVPERFEKIRILFEVRYDDKDPDEEPIEADVYYDDLHIGPAS